MVVQATRFQDLCGLGQGGLIQCLTHAYTTSITVRSTPNHNSLFLSFFLSLSLSLSLSPGEEGRLEDALVRVEGPQPNLL